MAKSSMGVIALIVFAVLLIALLPTLRNMLAPIFPEGFRDLDCKGVNCQEGEFCQENVCRKIYPDITNKYFPTS